MARVSITVLLAPVFVLAGTDQARAAPAGGQVQHGDVTWSQSGGEFQIDQQSHLGVVDWQSFSIGLDERVRVLQPDAASALLSRVRGADPSELLGSLQANGRFYLINPNGVVVGADATIDVGEFLASTRDVTDQDFLDGGTLLVEGGGNGAVINLGTIRAANGDVVLVGHSVSNQGEVSAAEGTAAFAAGDRVLLSPAGTDRVTVELAMPEGTAVGVDQAGVVAAAQVELEAAGGDVYALAINHSGFTRSTGVEHRDGRVLLVADGGRIAVDGSIQAHDADGAGGDVRIGGGARGRDPDLPNAAEVEVVEGARIDTAARRDDGDAGSLVVWSEQHTDFAGQVDGRATAGRGAQVEVSSANALRYTGRADLRAPAGEAGRLLLDPPDTEICDCQTPGDNQFHFADIDEALSLGDLEIDASMGGANFDADSIQVNAPLSWATASTLTLRSGFDIDVNADISGADGAVEFLPRVAPMTPESGTLRIDTAATVSTGTLRIAANDLDAQLPPSLGPLRIEGVVDTDTLIIDRGDGPGGIGNIFDGVDAIAIQNAGNDIGTLELTGSGDIDGPVRIVDGAGGLVLAGNLAEVRGAIEILTPGTLTLNDGFVASTAGDAGLPETFDLILASAGGSFVNLAGAGALSTRDAESDLDGRILVYADDPATSTLDGLALRPVYDRDLAANPPAGVTEAGDRVLYDLAPTLTITSNLERAIGESNPDPLPFQVSGLVGGDTLADAITGTPQLETTADEGSAAGQYPITVTPGTVQATDLNYGLSFTNGVLNVVSELLDVTADDFTRFFGDPNPAFTATITGFNDGDDESLVSGLEFMVAADATSNVGTYQITPFGATAAGYSVQFFPGTLTIDPRLLTISADSATMVFGDATPSLGLNFDNLAPFHSSAAIAGVSLSAPSHGGFPLDLSPPPDAGRYAVTVTGGVNPNYDITRVGGTLIINPRPVTAIATDRTREYGLGNPTLLFGIDNEIGTAPLDRSGIGIQTAAVAVSDVGTYPIQLTGMAADPNYLVSFRPGTLTVTPAPLRVDVDDVERQYGLDNPTFTADIDGLRVGDSAAEALAGITFDTTADLGSGVGFYPITASTAATSNYSLDVLGGVLRIRPAPLSFVGIALTERPYGDPNPEAFDLVVDGLRNNDFADEVIFGTFFTLANIRSPVGSYTVTLRGASASSNYVLPPTGVANGTLNVVPRPVTITAPDFTREYGTPNPVVTVTGDNFPDFEDLDQAFPNLEVSVPALDSPADTRPVVPSDPVGNPNYDPTFVSGLAHITPAPISVFSGEFSLLFGEAVPFLDGAVGAEQMRLGEDPAILGLRSELSGSVPDAGTYSLDFTLTNPNYRIDNEAQTLTVLPRPVTVSFGPDLVRPYGDANDELAVFVDAPQRGDAVFDIIEVFSEGGQFSPPGDYPVRAEVINPNYVLGEQALGQMTIVPRVIALKPENFIRTYGDLSRPLQILIGENGLAPGDSIEDLVGDVRIITDDGTANLSELLSNPGVDRGLGAGINLSLVQLDGPLIDNYAVNSLPGWFEVQPRPVTLTVLDEVSRNDFIPTFTIGVDNLAPGDLPGLAYPDLDFEIITRDGAAEIQSLEPVEIPDFLTDARFLSTYPIRTTVDLTGADGTLNCDTGCTQVFDQEATLATQAPENLPVAITETASESGTGRPTTEIETTYLALADVETVQLAIPADAEAIGLLDTIEIGESLELEFDDSDLVLLPDGSLAVRDELPDDDFPAFEEVRIVDSQLFYVRPSGYDNPNYVVTAVNNGRMTVIEDPNVVAALREAQDEARRQHEMRRAFYRPEGGVGAYGMREEELPVMIDAIKWFLQRESATADIINDTLGTDLDGESWLSVTLRQSSLYEEDRENITDADWAYFLSDVHSDPLKQAAIGPVLMDYSMTLLQKDAADMNASELAYAQRFQDAAQVTTRRFTENLEAAYERDEAERIRNQELAGNVPVWELPDYRQMIREASQDTVTQTVDTALIATVTTSGVVAGTAAFATIAATAGTILPFATVSIAATKAGAMIASAAMMTAGTAVAGVAGAALGVVAGAAAIGYQIYGLVDDNYMRQKFSALKEGGGDAAQFTDPTPGGIHVEADNPVQEHLMMATLTEMFYGQGAQMGPAALDWRP
ncbi:MBG domain-containing protein [Panacagrimonas sp.]|uniref:MBG domain-containing protein n=1 Tax=Panacagrimonas sp. TaxID=2480088 RepID=UPI003B52F030